MSIAGWLPRDWSTAIVPIAMETEENRFTPVGTAFMVDSDGLNCLITAKHVVFDGDSPRTSLFVLHNLVGGGIRAKSLDDIAAGGPSWVPHPEKDVAAIPFPVVETDDVRKFPASLFETYGNIHEGDDVFFLGFPLGIVRGQRITPIVRAGMVALKQEDEGLLIEANAFPGNSGSPVFFKPCPFEMVPGGLTLGRMRPPKLLGAITSYIPYQDVALSQQTHRPRIVFEENSGLAAVLSVRIIQETLNSTAFRDIIPSRS